MMRSTHDMNITTFILSLTQCLTLEHRVGRGEMRFSRWSSYIQNSVSPSFPITRKLTLASKWMSSTMWNDFQCPSPEGENIQTYYKTFLQIG